MIAGCACVRCSFCGGTGHYRVDTGEGFEDEEVCEECFGSGVSEVCDACREAFDEE